MCLIGVSYKRLLLLHDILYEDGVETPFGLWVTVEPCFSESVKECVLSLFATMSA